MSPYHHALPLLAGAFGADQHGLGFGRETWVNGHLAEDEGLVGLDVRGHGLWSLGFGCLDKVVTFCFIRSTTQVISGAWELGQLRCCDFS